MLTGVRLIRLLKKDSAKEISTWVDRELISVDQVQAICRLYGVDYTAILARSTAYSLLVVLGGVFIGLALVWFFMEYALGERTRHLRVGEVVSVSLQQSEEQAYEFAGASLDRPADGVFLRGRITQNTPPYRVRYELEAFFAPKDTAVQLEDALRSGGLAVVMISETGEAALKDVIPHPAQD